MSYITRKYKDFIHKNKYIPQYFNVYNTSEIKDYSTALTTNCGSYTGTSSILIKKEKDNMLYIRKLVPEECFVLQGMTVEDVEKARAVGICDSHLYAQAGNGLVTNCVQYLMEHLYKATVDENYETTDERYVREGYGVE